MYFTFSDEVPDDFGKKFTEIRKERGYKTFYEWVRAKMREEVGDYK